MKSEVIKIRIDSADKKRLQDIADRECRTFSDQCRFALREWLKREEGREHE